MEKVLKDKIAFSDDRSNHVKMPMMQSHGLWSRTEVMGSYDDVELDKNGIFTRFVKKIPNGVSTLGETLFRTETTEPKWKLSNMVPIGGCQFAMEMLFGVKGTQFTVPTLYNDNSSIDTHLAGLPDSSIPTTVYDVPGGTKTVIYNNGNLVQLFGIGITGTAENDITVHNVDYRENSLNINRVTTDGLTLHGTMIPFRHTASTLSDNDKLKYFGKKTTGGVTSYYLKRFESDPVIKHIWKTGEDVDSEVLVSSSDVWSNNTEANIIESFTEFILRITKEDVKEWFIAQGQEDRTRINTIALFTGQYVKNADGSIGDYRDVRMFSKLNIPVEYLSLTKDLNLVYRVYTS